ncbi:hypothetical protein [Cycloclasticus pugetii]|uniref:hypothetical protein n=1 Tax=Cycloclasticus pugetii TaxID=34068 RepID=UPI003A8E2FE7
MIALALTGSAFVGMGLLIWWLHGNNQALVADKQRLTQTNAALAESAENQKATADTLAADVAKRDELARRAFQAREESDKRLERVKRQLHDALEADRCAREPHPAAVGDWLRKNSDGL